MSDKPGGFLGWLFGSARTKDGKTIVQALTDVFGPRVGEGVQSAAQEEHDRPPRIAMIGTCGVGKTSTINALFGTGLPVSHVEACTQEEHEVTVVDGTNGRIIVYDMPGLGEDVEADERHKKTYARVLAECDVGIWILKADSRVLAYDQTMIRDVVSMANENVAKRLVVAINQIDLIQPGEWSVEANFPSELQLSSIQQKVNDVQRSLVKICPTLTTDRIIPFSALRRFRLDRLFTAMINACASERGWVLAERKALADYVELILDPELQQEARFRQRRTAHG